MTIRHLKIFIAVAETGSMSAAAQQLYLSQPTVSQAIRELEAHYQVRLFERLSRKLYITEEGSQLLSLAHQAVGQFETLENTMHQKRETPSLRIGSSITVGTCLIPSVVDDLERLNPGIQIFNLVSNTQVIEEKLLKSQLDVAVVEGNIESADLVCTPVIPDRMVLVCGRSHPFYNRKHITSRELSGQKFAMREHGSGTRKLFEQYLSKRNLHIQVAWEANCPRTILNAVLKNNMLTVMSSRLIRHEIARSSVKIFQNESEDWDRDFKLVYHKNKIITPGIFALEGTLDMYKTFDWAEKNLGILTDE